MNATRSGPTTSDGILSTSNPTTLEVGKATQQPRNQVLPKSTAISLLWQSYGSFYACMWVQFGDGEVGGAEAGLDRVWLLGLWMQADLPTVQTSSKLRFHRGSMDPILRLRIPVLTVSRVNGSDFTHLGTSFHRKLFNCLLTTVKTGTQMCKI
jgi:hypothetical protein